MVVCLCWILITNFIVYFFQNCNSKRNTARQPLLFSNYKITILKKKWTKKLFFRIWFMVMDSCNQTDRYLYYHILHSWHSNLPIHRGDYSIFGPPFVIEKAIQRQFHTSFITIITFATFTIIASCKRKLNNKYGFLTPCPYTADIIDARSLMVS